MGDLINPYSLKTKKSIRIGCSFLFVCGERGIRTPGASQHGGFQDRCNRPLYHLSERHCDGSWSEKRVQRYKEKLKVES